MAATGFSEGVLDASRRHRLILLAFFAAALSLSCGRKAKAPTPGASRTPKPAPTQPTPTEPHTPPRAATTPAPADRQPARPSSIRIGLQANLKEVRIASAGEFYVSPDAPNAARKQLQGELLVRTSQDGGGGSAMFRVQVGSFSRRETAEELQATIAEQLAVPVIVRRNAASGTHQVRVGAFASRQQAEGFRSGELAGAGFTDTLIVRENGTAGNGSSTLLAEVGGKSLESSRSYRIFPETDTAFLTVNGKPYRGVIDLSSSANGTITVINELGIEEYLFGVVPAEISPTTYPEPAALKAQAIAARTYALRNMGRFRSEGYDLTSDVRTQVYGGVAEEKEATTRAVRDTFGVAMFYDGKPIDAMYSSTCGGRTEDFANVFDGQPVPYLRGVRCAIESNAIDVVATTLRGDHALREAVFADAGSPANREIELAALLGFAIQQIAPDRLSAPLTHGEARSWVARAIELARRADGGESTLSGNPPSRAGFLAYAASRFFGNEVLRWITGADAAYYLGSLKDGFDVPAAARNFIAFLMQGGFWRPYPDNTVRPAEPMRRLDALSILLQWVESSHKQLLRAGRFIGPADNGLAIKVGSRNEVYRLGDKLRLFRISGGRSTAVDSLRIIGNEKLSFHLDSDGRIDFLEVELNPTGTASDRYSPAATWQTTLTRGAVAEKLRAVAADIGELRDLKPARLGSSGRAVQIELIGSRRSAVLNGYRVRGILGLKDTMFTITRSLNRDGSIESFTFDGRGWGHGVGLCQVGAFGMARSGRSAEEILRTYYQGIEIRKAY
jgi:stage II sporulation protein D